MVTSLQEYCFLTEDFHHQLSQSSPPVHNPGASNRLSSSPVDIIGFLTRFEGGIDSGDRGIERLACPYFKVAGVEFGGGHGVRFDHVVALSSVVGPEFVVHWQVNKACVVVDNAVPDRVEVADAGFAGDVLEVATSVAFGILGVD